MVFSKVLVIVTPPKSRALLDPIRGADVSNRWDGLYFFFLHTKTARRKCLKHQRQRRFFVLWGREQFWAFDARPKIQVAGPPLISLGGAFNYFSFSPLPGGSGPI